MLVMAGVVLARVMAKAAVAQRNCNYCWPKNLPTTFDL